MQFPERLENTPLNLLFTIIGGKSKYQGQGSFLEYILFLRFGDLKNESHFLKKATFTSIPDFHLLK